MLCGQIGKWASGVNPMRGQNNVQGACDMGAMPHKLPGYQNWHRRGHARELRAGLGRARCRRPWACASRDARGRRPGDLKAMFIMGQDLVATEPNQHQVVARLEQLEFLVVQEIFMTETAKLAPTWSCRRRLFAEKDGTFTSSERRVQLVRKAVRAAGRGQADWEIICRLAARDGHTRCRTQRRSRSTTRWPACRPTSPASAYERIENETACSGRARARITPARRSCTRAGSRAARACFTPSRSRPPGGAATTSTR